ncbi:MAG: hypothetical protein AAF942_15495 [Pseudomonadota bacterium]
MSATAQNLVSEDTRKDGMEDPNEISRRQRRKNIALAVLLAAFAVLVYFVAIVRMGGGS